MYIEKVHLRDWKSYVDETYEFPKPTRSKNVVLIGAENGYGKTSLLEALMLCLYGREGLHHIPRATLVDGNDQKLDLSYDEFLRRAFHGCALDSGRNSVSVTVTLNDDGQRTSVQRQWYFAGNGRHRPTDEEVRIYVDGEPFRAGRFDDDKQDAYRNYIAKAFVPVFLAPFFLFDGEQVQRLADKDMASQVRTGIEGLLGVGTLRELQDDLRDYAQSRRVGAPRTGDVTLEQLQSDVRSLSDELKAAQRELQQKETKLPQLRETKEARLRTLRSIVGGNSASIKDLYEQKSKADGRRLQLRDKLLDFLHSDLALTIAGVKLRESVANRLRAEEKRESWEAGKLQGEQHLHKLEAALVQSAEIPDPPLTSAQLEWLKRRLSAAWESLWFPPPSDCSEDYRHTYLLGRDRSVAMTRIEQINRIVLGDLQELIEGLTEAEGEIKRVEGRVRELSGVEEQAQKLTEDIEKITRDEQEVSVAAQELRRKCEGLKAQLGSKNADVERVREQLGRSQPMLARADKAERIAIMVDALIGEMYPLKVKEVASAMTRIYKSLAHKKLVQRVNITEDCNVELLDRRGNDLRRFDASAGENQIFAVALISAIAEVSKAEVPLVVDTPLARLDTEHRMNVLAHLASQPGQVILLSATDEVAGDYLKAVESRVCCEYHIEHEELDAGIGVSRVVPGYLGRANGRRSVAGSMQ